MLGAPALHPRDVLGAAEVVLVLGLGKPLVLAGRFARLTARGCAAIALVFYVARIHPEPCSATPALTLFLAFHDLPPCADHARLPAGNLSG